MACRPYAIPASAMPSPPSKSPQRNEFMTDFTDRTPTANLGVARRMDFIAPFQVMELLTRAKQLEAADRSVVHMEVGEPDFPTPEPVIDAATAFIRNGSVYYTPSGGIPALRQEISDWYHRRYGVEVSP